MSSQNGNPLRAVTDPELIAKFDAIHASAIADAVLAGFCADASAMLGVVCTCAPSHAGPHNNGEWQWGYDSLAPHVLRPLPPSP